MTDRTANAAKSTTVQKPADRQPAQERRDPSWCVVGDCRNRRVPDSKVCSAHTMHYYRDGSRRDGKGRNG
ncbi:MAG TPA: hypothetical protein VIQ30_19410 [Pseudonocardia sp.]